MAVADRLGRHHTGERRPCRLPRRHHAEPDADGQRRGQAEQRPSRRTRASPPPAATPRESTPAPLSGSRRRRRCRAPANRREHQALGEQLPDDASAPGAERGSHGDLPRARGRSRQQQIGDVRAAGAAHAAHHTAGRPTSSANRFRRCRREPVRRDAVPGSLRDTRASRSAITASSACAASIVTSGFRRATTSKARMARSTGASGNWGDSVQISAGRENCTCRRPRRRPCMADRSSGRTPDDRGIGAEPAAPHGFTEQHRAARDRRLRA